MTKPFLKWAGGKTILKNEILNLFPKEINNYYEPFIGGGSILIELLNRIEKKDIKVKNRIIASDINQELINLYILIKDNPEYVIKWIDIYIKPYELAEEIKYESRHKYIINNNDNINELIKKGKSYIYYFFRNAFNKCKDKNKKSILLLFLNKTCFRGLFREGPNGFNVPYGNYKNPSFYSKENIYSLSNLFNKYKVSFINKSFQNDNVYKNDFLYLDPPYYPIKKTSFKMYKYNTYNDKDLINYCNKLNDNNIKFLQSNSFCKFNLDNYKQYNIKKILCKRRINSKNPSDKDYEIFIYNY